MMFKFNPAYSRTGIAQNGLTQVGTPGNDVLHGTPNGNNVLIGNGGSDRIFGGRSNDVLVGANQAGFTIPANPTSTATAIPTPTTTPISTPTPTTTPTALVQPVNGTANADTLIGTNQAEIFRGGEGTDRIFGGGGDDVNVWNPRDGSDAFDGGAGIDKSMINLGGDSEVSMLRSNGGTAVFDRLTQSPFRMTHAGTEQLEVNGKGGNDILITDKLAHTGANTITFAGGEGNDVLFGGTSDIPLHAAGDVGDDILIGGRHSNILSGGAGNDFIVGNQGTDYIMFGSGKPFNSADLGTDTIANFNPAQDKINLSKATFASIAAQPGQPLGASDFARVDSDEAAALSAAKITYVQLTGSSSGKLFYNPNGVEPGLGNGAQFAVVAGAPTLSDQAFGLMA